mgnify:CR=1 FL=1
MVLTGGLPTKRMRFLSRAACCSLKTKGPNKPRYCSIASAGWYSGSRSSSLAIAVTVEIARSRMEPLLSACFVLGVLVCSAQNSSRGATVSSWASAAAIFSSRAASSQPLPSLPNRPSLLTSMPTETKFAFRSSALASPLANALSPA